MQLISSVLVALAVTLTSVSAQSGNEKIIFALEVTRHGARSPQEVLPFNATPDNFNNTMQLLQSGFIQHFKSGEMLRKRYVQENHLLTKEYNSSEVFIYTTDAARTILSSIAHLSGIFPDNAPNNDWLPIPPGKGQEGFNITIGDPNTNWLTKLSTNNCPEYNGAFNDVSNSDSYAEARGYYYKKYRTQLEQLVGWDNLTSLSFDDICDYLFYQQYTNIALNFTPSEHDRAFCQAFENGWIYQTAMGLPLEWHLLSFEFLNQLQEFSQFFQGEKALDDLTTFQKYYKINNSDAPFPKYIGYFTHDEVMGGYYEGLGWHNHKGTFPAGSLFFEFFKNSTNQIYVRSFFKESLTTEPEPVVIEGETSNTLTIQEFQAAVARRIEASGITDLNSECFKSYESKRDYYDPHEWIEEMGEIYPGSNETASVKRSRIQIQIKKFIQANQRN